MLESSGRVGGVIESESKDGFLIERGPNSARLTPDLWKLIVDLGLTAQIVSPLPGSENRFLAPTLELERQRKSAEPIPVPLSVGAALRSPLLRYLGWPSIFRDLTFWRAPTDDESVASFFDDRFGRRVREQLVAPALNGIFAADITRLSSRSALNRLWALQSKHGSVLRGVLRRRMSKTTANSGSSRPTTPMPKPESISFQHGLAQLTDALAASLPAEAICLETIVKQIIPESGGVRIEIQSDAFDSRDVNLAPPSFQRMMHTLAAAQSSFVAGHVILALPSRALAPLIAPLDPACSQALDSISYAPVGVIHLAIEKSAVRHPLNGFGMLVPPSRGSPLLGVLFTSSLYPGRAPTPCHLLTCFVGGACFPTKADPESIAVQESVQDALKLFLGLKHPAQILTTTNYSAAIPNYAIGHHHVVEKIQAFSRANPQVHILSNAIEGVGIPDRVTHAEALVRQILSMPKRESLETSVSPLLH